MFLDWLTSNEDTMSFIELIYPVLFHLISPFKVIFSKILIVIWKPSTSFPHVNVKMGSLFMKIDLIRKYIYEH